MSAGTKRNWKQNAGRALLLVGLSTVSSADLGQGLSALAQGVQRSVSYSVRLSANGEGRAPLDVTMSATVPDGYRVAWDFGDGQQGAGADVQHTYYRAGSYSINTQILDSQGRVVTTAAGQIDVQSSGAERAEVTLLLGAGEVRVSAAGSVAYAPGTPQFQVDGREVGPKAVALAAGPHRVTVRMAGSAGLLERSLSFTMAPLGGSVPYDAEVLRLTNRARQRGWNCATKKEGGPALPPLARNSQLDLAATAQSAGMALAGYFDHQSALDGSTPFRRVQATGMKPRSSAENIAAGQTSPEEVVDGWLHSPGHCHNIMGEFSFIGLSYVTRPGTKYKTYWTQVFARL
ncbi:PKD domain-containing protein [Deinococcus sp. Arct2-2]|uniref:CAP domain-containing protein n=1 Tax=Deinococcus sp. Arct2-2 TaxID=2568653 RepID=UPI0010A36B5A|nr:CAP domain-containing protein [Deinococcus sp. Arct2-2]THF68260.1 PKD domain-containing protein [Deinococcus sp. Arct2-2]